MESWDEYAKWIASLNKGRNVLPDQTRMIVPEMVANIGSREANKPATQTDFPSSQFNHAIVAVPNGSDTAAKPTIPKWFS